MHAHVGFETFQKCKGHHRFRDEMMRKSWKRTNEIVMNGNKRLEKILYSLERTLSTHEMLLTMKAEEMGGETNGEFNISCKGSRRRWKILKDGLETRYEFKLTFSILEGEDCKEEEEDDDSKESLQNAEESLKDDGDDAENAQHAQRSEADDEQLLEHSEHARLLELARLEDYKESISSYSIPHSHNEKKKKNNEDKALNEKEWNSLKMRDIFKDL